MCLKRMFVCLYKPQTGFCKHFSSLWVKQLLLSECVKRMFELKQLLVANTLLFQSYFLCFLHIPTCFSSSFSLFLYAVPFCLSSFLFISSDAAQLYQQYSEAAQNSEIVSQSRSSTLSVCEDNIPSPTPSPPPARRPLPPLPAVPHPHSLSHSGSITSVKSLPLPEPPKIEGRPPSPRLSFSISKSVTLWRDLPGVRNSSELEELTEGQRRLQEVAVLHINARSSFDISVVDSLKNFGEARVVNWF